MSQASILLPGNVRRLWYAGCPKYEQYHYASQFVYSKAEKGKKVELPVNSKPFSVVSPGGERIPVVVRQPGINTVARDDPIRDTVEWASPIVLNPEDFESIIKVPQLGFNFLFVKATACFKTHNC
ncbi:hypothetical protein ANCCAN_07897 [Ancylostoma caninum]|uniref:Uncharacterized protein n=1 Tax=Ancylostoma caninum TaxID=29170 RepID=A0A368GT08_ANCCA|nr:hypothetical protein ANCCAN_07897 [Ancylostoma caninum]